MFFLTKQGWGKECVRRGELSSVLGKRRSGDGRGNTIADGGEGATRLQWLLFKVGNRSCKKQRGGGEGVPLKTLRGR